MYYPFQSATRLDDYLGAIRGSNEFVVRRDVEAGMVVINYNYISDTTFPSPTDLLGESRRLAILRRDCRGIEFDLTSGEIVTRKYHKFFNLNEKPETQAHRIDWSQPHHILEKLDGSQITPYRRRDGGYQWHTRFGLTPAAALVNRFVAGSDLAYVAFAQAMREAGKTPIFEWCSPNQRIVIDHPGDRLVLTAMRETGSGAYEPYHALRDHARRFGLPLVQALDAGITDIRDFICDVGDLKHAEGYVIRFADGHAVKVKGSWYCRIHKFQEQIKSEKNVWELLLNNGLDDIRPFIPPSELMAVEAFAKEFYEQLGRTARRLANKVAEHRHLDRKEFATDVVERSACYERKMLYRVWSGQDAWTVVVNHLRTSLGSQTQIDSVRPVLEGLSWRSFYGSVDQ